MRVDRTKKVGKVFVELVMADGWPGHRPYTIRKTLADGTVVGIERRWSTDKKSALRNGRAAFAKAVGSLS